jgi:hypothetical protein
MAIPAHIISHFNALSAAFTNNDACIIETTAKADGAPAYALCIAYRYPNGDADIHPIALMFATEPTDLLNPPADATVVTNDNNPKHTAIIDATN